MAAHSPQPTDHDPEAGSTLNRREFAKAVGMAAAIGGGAAASSGTARADGIVDGVRSAVPRAATAAKYGVAATGPFGAAGVMGLAAYGELRDSLNANPSADKAILHQLCTSEYKSLTQHETTFSNRITDAKPVAHLEARNGIATGWEEGDSASQGYDRSLGRIRQYWELPEFNHVHITNKSLLQLKYVAEVARASDFNFPITAGSENSSGTFRQVKFTGETIEVDFTLHDGTSISNIKEGENEDVLGDYDSAALETPILEFIDPNNGDEQIGTSPAITNAVVDSWDSSNEEVTYEVGGESITTQLDFVVNSVASADLESAQVFDGTVFFDLIDRIRTNSDETVGTYDVSFVEDLYGELDAGNITPRQVRGPEGMTHFLSGTEDPTHAQFRIAMMTTLGLEQPDFTRVSQMTVSWTGATGRRIDSNPNLDKRHVYPDEFVDGKSYQGVLFGDTVPVGGFDPGSAYSVGESLYTVDDSGNLQVFDAFSGAFQWQKTLSNTPESVAASHNGDIVAAGTQSSVELYDTNDGSQLWTASPGGYVSGLEFDADDSTVYASDTDSGIYSYDVETGEQNWSNTTGNDGQSIALSPDGNSLYVGIAFGNVEKVDATDGSNIWTHSASHEGWVEAVAADENRVYAASQTSGIYAYDQADGTQVWNYTGVTGTGITLSQDDGSVIAVGDTEIASIDPSDGTENWRTTLSGSVVSVTQVPGGKRFIAAGPIDDPVLVNGDDGSVAGTLPEPSSSTNQIAIGVGNLGADVDGAAGSGLMFDKEANADISLSNGVVTVEKMTDAEGATITHVNDQTIGDLESLSGTPDSVETIVSDMDEFGSADDIKYIRDLETILDHYGVKASIGGEGESADITVQDTDYSRPDYGTTSSADFAAEINSLEEKIEQLKAEEDGGGGPGPILPDGFGLGDSGALVGFAIIGVVVLAVVGFVTDLIPGLGN